MGRSSLKTLTSTLCAGTLLLTALPAHSQLLQALQGAVFAKSLIPPAAARASRDTRFADTVVCGPLSVALTGIHKEDTYTLRSTQQVITPTAGMTLYVVDITVSNLVANGEQPVVVLNPLLGSGNSYYMPITVGDWKGLDALPTLQGGKSGRATVVFGVPIGFKPTGVSFIICDANVKVKLN